MYFSRVLPLIFLSTALAAPAVTNKGSVAVRDAGAVAGSKAQLGSRDDVLVMRELSLAGLAQLIRDLLPLGTNPASLPLSQILDLVKSLPLGTTIFDVLEAIGLLHE